MAEEGSDDEEQLIGINGLIGIIVSALLVCLTLLIVASAVVSKPKTDEKRRCCAPIAKRFSELKKIQCCAKLKSAPFISRIRIFQKDFWIRKAPADAVRLVETESAEPSIREWQQTIPTKLETSEPKTGILINKLLLISFTIKNVSMYISYKRVRKF